MSKAKFKDYTGALQRRHRTARKAIPKSLRFAVLTRDGFRCRYCGAGPGDGIKLHMDHRKPLSRGGLDTFENLFTACEDCNLGKSDSELNGVLPEQREIALGALFYRTVLEKWPGEAESADDFNSVMDAAFTLHESHLSHLIFDCEEPAWSKARAIMKVHTLWAKNLESDHADRDVIL